MKIDGNNLWIYITDQEVAGNSLIFSIFTNSVFKISWGNHIFLGNICLFNINIPAKKSSFWISTTYIRLLQIPANICFLWRAQKFENFIQQYYAAQQKFVCSKSTTETPEKGIKRHSVVCIVNFEHISNLFLVFLFFALNR